MSNQPDEKAIENLRRSWAEAHQPGADIPNDWLVPALRDHQRQIGRKGGLCRSERKAKAARWNGLLPSLRKLLYELLTRG
jgi:hypothetical protein